MLAARFGLGVKQHDVIEDFVHRDNYNSGSSMLNKVLLWCLGIEVIGALALYLSWGPGVTFQHNGSSIFHSIFHSISAFNSAGITLFTDGFVNESVVQNWSVHWVITFLFDPARLRERMAQPWKKIDFATKIALYFSIGLVAFGAVGFWFLEQENTLSGMSYFGQFTTAIFQSTTRTSGFSTVNIGTVGIPMLFLFIILMFIGASSSSTGGGIKTSTFAIVLADVWRTIRSLDHVQLFQRTIPEILRSRAYSVLLFFLAGNTTGITPMLSNAGKVIVILSMFIGRVGTLTVAFALGGKYIKRHIKYPTGHTMVG